jgi:hypothetical protein
MPVGAVGFNVDERRGKVLAGKVQISVGFADDRLQLFLPLQHLQSFLQCLLVECFLERLPLQPLPPLLLLFFMFFFFIQRHGLPSNDPERAIFPHQERATIVAHAQGMRPGAQLLRIAFFIFFQVLLDNGFALRLSGGKNLKSERFSIFTLYVDCVTDF